MKIHLAPFVERKGDNYAQCFNCGARVHLTKKLESEIRTKEGDVLQLINRAVKSMKKPCCNNPHYYWHFQETRLEVLGW